MTTLDRIKELAAKQFGGQTATIDVNADVSMLGVDSLGFLEFMFTLEDAFGLSIPTEAVAGVRTLRQLADAVDRLLASEAAKPAQT